MKKILIFNGYYYPSKNCGGPITSIENIVNACYKKFEFYIICYNHDFGKKNRFDVEINKWVKVGNAKVMYVEQGYLDFSIKNMKKILVELNPNLIWFSGVLRPNNKLVTVYNARKLKIPVLFSPRGEVSEDRVKIKAYKKVPYLTLLKRFSIYRDCYFHGTSNDEIKGIKKYFSPSEDHIFKIANIGISMQKDIVNIKKEKGKVKIIFFSRIHEVKNLLYAIKCVNNCKTKVEFDIFGPIEAEEYWNECLNEMKKAPNNIKINYKGCLTHSEMNARIQGYDCLLFPTLNENYGHVIAETLANSRPVILSKGTTPWDDINNVAGFVINLNNMNEFTQKIDYIANLSYEQFNEVVQKTKRYFIQKISQDDAIFGHINMIDSIITKENSKNK